MYDLRILLQKGKLKVGYKLLTSFFIFILSENFSIKYSSFPLINITLFFPWFNESQNASKIRNARNKIYGNLYFKNESHDQWWITPEVIIQITFSLNSFHHIPQWPIKQMHVLMRVINIRKVSLKIFILKHMLLSLKMVS